MSPTEVPVRAARSRKGPAVAMALAMVLGAACNFDSVTRPLVDPLNSMVSAIDGAVAQITAASGSWQTVLQDTLKQLTADAQSTVRNEIQTLLSNSIAAVQVGVMCTTDFVGHRVVTVLQEIKAKLLGGSPPIAVPFVCSSSPLAVEFAAWQQSRVPVITLTGFDLKLPLTVHHVETTGTTVVPDVVAEVSPYQATINLGATGLKLTERSQRIVVSTTAQPVIELTAINIVQPQPKICEERDLPPNTPAAISFLPENHIAGDKEFGGHGPHITASLVILPVQGSLTYVFTMIARETGGDHTEVRGMTSGTLQLNPPLPSGMRILSVNGQLESDVEYIDRNHDNDTLPANGGPVREFVFIGDTDGDDVGRTRLLRASFNPLGLHAVEVGNCVTRSQARSLLADGRGVTSALVAHLQAATNP
jgi:hypothetical protein